MRFDSCGWIVRAEDFVPQMVLDDGEPSDRVVDLKAEDSFMVR